MAKSAHQKLVEKARKIAEKSPATDTWRAAWARIVPELEAAAEKRAAIVRPNDKKYMARHFMQLARTAMLEAFVGGEDIQTARSRALEAVVGKQ